ncbi:MAG TPA: glycosyl transferase, partial [Limnochordia bacterium]|nr:glycosyl transferase [Limnochordia bacterium]
MAHPLNVIFVGTYPPRRCGIATFTQDLVRACDGVLEYSPQIVALNAAGETYDYPEEVQFEIRRDYPEDYRRAAEWINRSSADLVCIQHEYGIYGGLAGDYLFTLLRDVKKPVVTTMHTVLKDPLPEYEAATHELVKHSDLLVVMSQVSKKILM